MRTPNNGKRSPATPVPADQDARTADGVTPASADPTANPVDVCDSAPTPLHQRPDEPSDLFDWLGIITL